MISPVPEALPCFVILFLMDRLTEVNGVFPVFRTGEGRILGRGVVYVDNMRSCCYYLQHGAQAIA